MGPGGLDHEDGPGPWSDADHEACPKPGTVYSAEGINTGLAADLGRPAHFPATAHCTGCEEVIRRERFMRMTPGDDGEWKHTGRKPGEPE